MEVGCLGKLSAVCHGCSVHSCRDEHAACLQIHVLACISLATLVSDDSVTLFASKT